VQREGGVQGEANHAQLAFGDLGKVEEVVDVGQEELGRPLDAGREVALLLGEAGLQQETVEAQDAVDRSPDLMRYLHTPVRPCEVVMAMKMVVMAMMGMDRGERPRRTMPRKVSLSEFSFSSFFLAVMSISLTRKADSPVRTWITD
jgi:hypothetical protein